MADEVRDALERIRAEIRKALVGKDELLELLLAALIAGGHVLIEDVPGLGKTMLAKALARSLDCSFSRIQFTPDLMPSDVTGASVYNQRSGDFEYRPGPIMANIVLADEVNRATPRTQSALLEAMEERQVTVDGVTHALSSPFCVIATQNPIEQEGTFPLPEAQLDRFLIRLSLGYPEYEEERLIVRRFASADALSSVRAVADATTLNGLMRAAATVALQPAVEDYLLAVVRATREDDDIVLGASPRAALALARIGRALAFGAGRSYVLPDDIRRAAKPVLAHRLILAPEARLRGRDAANCLDRILGAIPVPVEPAAE
jgi:MoxR-like ATPase